MPASRTALRHHRLFYDLFTTSYASPHDTFTTCSRPPAYLTFSVSLAVLSPASSRLAANPIYLRMYLRLLIAQYNCICDSAVSCDARSAALPGACCGGGRRGHILNSPWRGSLPGRPPPSSSTRPIARGNLISSAPRRASRHAPASRHRDASASASSDPVRRRPRCPAHTAASCCVP